MALAVFVMLFQVPNTNAQGSKEVANLSVKSERKIDAVTAFDSASKGDLFLVDIRSPQEWQQTGVASVAKTISMHQPGFLDKLNALIGDDKSKPVALICATGGRSNWLQGELVKLGYTGIIDVAEGMMGSPSGPGWLKRGLPLAKQNP